MNYDNNMYDVQYGKGKGYYGDTVEKGIDTCTVEKGTVWRYSGEGYSMGIQGRRVQYDYNCLIGVRKL